MIVYKTNFFPPINQIINLYKNAGLNRPIEDIKRIEKMYAHSNVVISAWDDSQLIGIARGLSDYAYCCYLSDLAVHKDYQNKKIGKNLIEKVKESIGKQSMLLLLSAEKAMYYYPKVGFKLAHNAFMIESKV